MYFMIHLYCGCISKSLVGMDQYLKLGSIIEIPAVYGYSPSIIVQALREIGLPPIFLLRKVWKTSFEFERKLFTKLVFAARILCAVKSILIILNLIVRQKFFNLLILSTKNRTGKVSSVSHIKHHLHSI